MIANWEDGGVEKDPHAATWQMGAIEQGYSSKRGSIPEGRWEVASLVVAVLRTHYSSELGDASHPARVLGLRGRPCRQCVTLLADDERVNAARPFLPRWICDHR